MKMSANVIVTSFSLKDTLVFKLECRITAYISFLYLVQQNLL
jgi:hypothetical protein